MDDSSDRLNFDLGKKNEIHHCSRKSILKLVKLVHNSRTLYTFVLRTEVCTTFGAKFLHIIQKYTKFAGLYFPHFTTFRDQTLQFE